MKVLLLVISLSFLFMACGGGSSSDDIKVDKNPSIQLVQSEIDLPLCDDTRIGYVYYIAADKIFKHCDGNIFIDLDLKGQDGTDGTDGLAGTNGNNGIDGKDGVNGVNGVAGIDGKDGMKVAEEYEFHSLDLNNADNLATTQYEQTSLTDITLIKFTDGNGMTFINGTLIYFSDGVLINEHFSYSFYLKADKTDYIYKFRNYKNATLNFKIDISDTPKFSAAYNNDEYTYNDTYFSYKLTLND